MPVADSARADNSIAIIPSECFRWRARVQFKESFSTRAEAVNYAIQYGHNLIVESDEGNGPQFDVLDDPDRACTAGLSLESVETRDFLVEPEAAGWASLVLSSVYELTRRLAIVIAILYRRDVSPLLHLVAIKYRRADIQGAFRRAWLQVANSPARQRIAARTFSLISRAALLCRDLATQFAAAVASLYFREVNPRLRRAATRCWWSGSGVAFRRWQHRYSHGSSRDLARRCAAALGSLYIREIAPRLRHAAVLYRQSDIQSAFRRVWSRALLTGIDFTQQIAAAVGSLYIREIAPRLRHTASACRHAEIESALRHGIEAVAAPRPSNPSHVR